MTQSRHEQMLEAIKANTDSTDRLNKTMLATIEALHKYTNIKVGEEDDPEIECTPELADLLIEKLYNLFDAESTEGVLPVAIPTLIREPRSVVQVELVVATLIEAQYLRYDEGAGLLFKNKNRATNG